MSNVFDIRSEIFFSIVSEESYQTKISYIQTDFYATRYNIDIGDVWVL